MASEQQILQKLADPNLGFLRTNRLLRKLRRRGVATAASLPTLRALEAASDLGTTRTVMDVLASIGTPEAIAELRKGLAHPEDTTAVQAAAHLRRLKVLDAVPEMIEALNVGESQRGETARFAMLVDLCLLLWDRPDPEAVPVLRPFLTDRHRTARKRSAYALGWIGTPEAMAALAWGAEQLEERDRQFIDKALDDSFPRSQRAGLEGDPSA